MKRLTILLTALLTAALCAAPALAANRVETLTTDVALRADGSAHVTQVFSADTAEGTEFYVDRMDSGCLTYSRFAVSDENVGIDAELLSREIDYVPILSKFSATEKAEIRSREDFLRHWTAKESVVKWLGGSLASDLKKIDYLEGMIFYAGLELPVRLSHFEREGHIVALCRANDGPPPPFIRL